MTYVWQIHGSQFFTVLFGDAAAFDAWAVRLASGDWVGTNVFYQAPLYPYLLGVLYRLFGHDLTVVRVCQSLGGASACALLTIAGNALFGARAGLVSGLLLAAYAPAIFYDGLVQKAGLELLLVSWLLLSVARLENRVLSRDALFAGLALGCLGLSRENALVMAPALLFWLWLHGRRALWPVAAFVAGVSIVLAPVAIRNFSVSGEFLLTTSNVGTNLFIGNNENATGTYVPLRAGRGSAEFEQADARELAEAAVGHSLSAGQVSSYWRGRALDWISRHPGDWLRLTGRKVLLIWNSVETSDSEDLDSYADVSGVLRVANTFLSFGVVAPLGLLGVWLTRARWRELWVLHAMAAVYVLSVAAFFVFGRFRHPVVPLLVLFAGAGLSGLPAWWRQSSMGERALTAGGLAIAFLVCNVPVVSERAMKASTQYNLGVALNARGRPEDAIPRFESAIRLWPDHAPAHSNLGALRLAQGRADEALRHAQEAVRLDPGVAESHSTLGMALAALGRQDDAIASFQRAVDLAPQNPSIQGNLGTALSLAGRPGEAIIHLAEAVRLDPSDAAAHNNLGIALASSGRLDEAVLHFREAVRLRPDFAEAKANLERAQALERDQH